jgi:hypothetical protein
VGFDGTSGHQQLAGCQGSPGRSGGRFDTASSPTAPTRTSAPEPATPRCPRTTHPLQPPSTSPGSGPRPDRGSAAVPPTGGIRADSAFPRPSRSAKAPSACGPTWATTPPPAASTLTRRVLLPFTCQVPFPLVILVVSQLRECPAGRACRVLTTSRHLMPRE